MENPTPKLYDDYEISPFEMKNRLSLEYDDTVDDPFDELEVF